MFKISIAPYFEPICYYSQTTACQTLPNAATQLCQSWIVEKSQSIVSSSQENTLFPLSITYSLLPNTY